MTRILTMLALFAALVGCNTAEHDEPKEMEGMPAALIGDWTLTQIEGQPVTVERPPTMNVTLEGRLSGLAGVNRYFGGLNIEQMSTSRFNATNLGMTMMAGPPELMELEIRFTRLLGDADGMRIDGDTLTLTLAGKPVLMFVRDGAAVKP